jgi:hypothetical protein
MFDNIPEQKNLSSETCRPYTREGKLLSRKFARLYEGLILAMFHVYDFVEFNILTKRGVVTHTYCQLIEQEWRGGINRLLTVTREERRM